MENLKVTSINELKEYAKGQIVELPSFGDGQPFVAILKRPSMLSLVKTGKIPNSLLNYANSLFADGTRVALKQQSVDEEVMSKMFDVMDVICEASFVSPTYAELKEAGIELTDEQMMFIFGYSQTGVKQLESFRN